MKFVSSRELRINPGEVWKKLRQEKDLVITSNGKPVGVLTFADEDSLEDVLATLRQGRALAAATKIRRAAAAQGLNKMTQKNIEKVIQESRQAVRKSATGSRR